MSASEADMKASEQQGYHQFKADGTLYESFEHGSFEAFITEAKT